MDLVMGWEEDEPLSCRVCVEAKTIVFRLTIFLRLLIIATALLTNLHQKIVLMHSHKL